MRTHKLLPLLLSAALATPGCATGLLYTHTVRPLTLDMKKTPVGQTEKHASIKLLSFPNSAFGSYDLVAWGSAAIGDVAKEQGMKEVYSADVETVSILRIWNKYTLHVYGR